MSAGVMPDIYRHMARKSTVTKVLKSTLVNGKTTNTSTTFHPDKIYEPIDCKIKLEEDILPQAEEKFFILPNNELEEMIIDNKETNEDIISDIFEQIINQIVDSSPDQIRRNSTNDVQIDSRESANLHTHSTDTNTPRSIADDYTAEVDTHSCACQCHQSDRLLSNDYILFEQALKQTRFEQEKLVNKNRLIQTLKRQHDELMQIYQQNKYSKQQYQQQTKVDREQQTIQLDRQDSPVQTDMTTFAQKKISTCQQQQKSNATKLSNTQIPSRFPSTSSSTLPLPPPPPTTTTIVVNTNNSHEIVDLTEEDDDDEDNHTSQIPTPTRQSATSNVLSSLPSQAPISLPSPLTAPSPILPMATRIRQPNRSIRPNNSVPNSQFISLRPLPEHVPCDHTIARPQLSITQENATVRLTWNLHSTPMESIKNYEIYAYKQNATATSSDWKKIGTVKSMRLPMAVTLKEFQSNSHYAFAVRAISIHNHIGPFCEPRTIFTGLNSVQPLHTSQLLNVSTK